MNWPEVYLHMKAGTLLDEAHRKEVEQALEKYPFFALGRMMAAKLATKSGDPRAQNLRFLASLYAPSRQYYAFFLEERLRPRVPPPPRMTGGREAPTPPSPAKAQEESSAGEEPGPAEMPFSPVFWPPLQGWIAARQRLYGGFMERLRQELLLPEITLSPSADLSSAGPPSTPLPSLSEETHFPEAPSASAELVPTAISEEKEVSSSPPGEESQLAPPLPSAKSVSELQPDIPLRSLSVTVLPPPPTTRSYRHLQFELPFSKAPILRTSEPSAVEELPLSAPEADLPLSASVEVAPSESLSMEKGEIASIEERPATPPFQAAEESFPSPPPMSHFHREFLPLEETGSVHLPTESEVSIPTSVAYTSESPLRPLVPFDIDIHGSIHLPVPEPSESPSEELPSIGTVPPAEERGEVKPSSPVPPISDGPWQSFLQELQQQIPLPEGRVLSLSSELENLRREFIRRLLAQRPSLSSTPEPSAKSHLIDYLIDKLQSFPKASSSGESGAMELSAPAWEAPPAHPRIYTETMAKLYWSQGDLARAIEVYEVLCQKHPEKAEYYQSQIARIRAGEMP